MTITIRKIIQRRPRWLTVPVAAVMGGILALGAGGGAAYALTAATAPTPGNYALYGCVIGNNRTLAYVYTVAANFQGCPQGTFGVAWNSTGPQGPAGPQGPIGPQGIQGQAAVSDVGATAQGGSGRQLQHIGGTILQNGQGAGATSILQVQLSAGFYLISADVTFDRSVSADSGAPDTYGSLALWSGGPLINSNQTVATFTSGPLPRLVADPATTDATASGSKILEVPAGGIELNLGVFAYNADGSSVQYPGCAVNAGCTSDDLSLAGSVVAKSAHLQVAKLPAVQRTILLP